MRIVFWQVNLGPHQIPYIQHMIDDPRVEEVVLVAPVKFAEYRSGLGWEDNRYPLLSKTKVLLNPSDLVIEEILKKDVNSSVHLFSGISCSPFVLKVIKISSSYNIRRGIITEGPFTYRWGIPDVVPLWVHQIKFWLKNAKYLNMFDYVFAMGNDAVKYYERLSKRWEVFNFCYCTQEQPTKFIEIKGDIKYIFIGNLCKRKGVDILIKSFCDLYNKGICNWKLSIVGSGEQQLWLEKYVTDHGLQNNIIFLGAIKNSKIPDVLSEHDVHILPSRHDGWGAVVNEALQKGLFVICSDHCGSKDLLLSDTSRGIVFSIRKTGDLQSAIRKSLSEIDIIRCRRQERYNWAGQNINGAIVSKYMIDCLNGLKPSTPWLL